MERFKLSDVNKTMRSCSLYGMMGVVLLGASPVLSETMRIASDVRVDSRSGRLVRTRAVTPRDARPGAVRTSSRRPPPQPIAKLVDEVADRHAVEPELVHSVIQVESNYNPFALSPKGAQGLMQLIPSTAQRFGVRNAFDPSQNLEGGVKYLKHLLALYQGDERLALAAYNAGEGAVERWKGIPPYRETRHYVGEVGRRVRDARQNATKRTGDEAAPREFPVIVKRVGADGREYYSAR